VRPGKAGTAGPAIAGHGNDGGFTLLEVMVTMSILAVFLAVATDGLLSLYRLTDKAQAIADAQQQVGITFGRLDRELRYSSGISTPAYVGADPFVEFVTTSTGSPICTQLRLLVSDQQLEQRTWLQGTASITPSGWTVLANGVTTTSQPFALAVADATVNFQRLTVSVSAAGGGAGGASTRDFSAAFTALNTSLTTDSAAVCAEGRGLP
jgi:prepilin-type N-terminal cleavage/methylation domain-containing protein